MAVGLRVHSNVWVVGSQDFLHAFFSTCSARLESDGWATRFPALLDRLYRGELPADEVSRAREETQQIHDELRAFPPSEVVWDVEDPTADPPWGGDISADITDLSNYFVTQDGRDLFEVFDESLAYADRTDAPVVIESGI